MLLEHKEIGKNGNVRKTFFTLNGKLEGKCIEWHDNGLIRCEEYYKDGLLEGLYKWYYSNGRLGELFNYKQDQLHGSTKRWNEDGTLDTEGYYINGIFFKTETEAKQAELEASFVW